MNGSDLKKTWESLSETERTNFLKLTGLKRHDQINLHTQPHDDGTGPGRRPELGVVLRHYPPWDLPAHEQWVLIKLRSSKPSLSSFVIGYYDVELSKNKPFDVWYFNYEAQSAVDVEWWCALPDLNSRMSNYAMRLRNSLDAMVKLVVELSKATEPLTMKQAQVFGMATALLREVATIE